MFYFAHPFGISTPSTAGVRSDRRRPSNQCHPKTATPPVVNCRRATTTSCQRNHFNDGQHPAVSTTYQRQTTTYIPWPEKMWRFDENELLPTVVQAMAMQMGKSFLRLIPLLNLPIFNFGLIHLLFEMIKMF